MITVTLPHTEWENIVLLLTEIRDSDRFAVYLDTIVDSIDAALDEQKQVMETALSPCEGCGAEEGEECRWDCLSWVT